jgi:hypothetical protein
MIFSENRLPLFGITLYWPSAAQRRHGMMGGGRAIF